MRLACIALLASMWASSASAADVSGQFGLVSDYRYRGVSLSRGRPAVQGSLTIEHDSGLYGEIWGSTLERPGDPTDAEVDFTVGYSKDLSQSFSIDLSGSYFTYPAARSDNNFEATAIATVNRGAASTAFGLSYIPSQGATGHADNAYLFGTADYEIPSRPVTLKAGVGYERGAFDEVAHGGKWDW